MKNMKVKDLFEGHLDYRAKDGNSLKTIKEITRFLGRPIYEAVGEREISSLRLVDTVEVKDRGRRYGIYGEQRAVCYYRQLLEYAHKSGIKLPFDYHEVQIPTVPDTRVEYLTAEELDRVRACFDTSKPAGLRTRTLIEFLLDTGLRIGEAIGLNRDAVNFETKEIPVLNIKTKEWGTVFMNDRSVEWLKLYLENRHDDHPALFISGRSRLLALTSRNYIRQQTKHLGLGKKIGHHIFRRTLGTTLAQEKVDLKTVQEILRHKSERTTLKYYIGTNKERSKALHQEITARVFGDKLKYQFSN
jgi:integrase/recombinase XerD